MHQKEKEKREEEKEAKSCPWVTGDPRRTELVRTVNSIRINRTGNAVRVIIIIKVDYVIFDNHVEHKRVRRLLLT